MPPDVVMSYVYLVRHAKAEARVAGIDHPARPLTKKGQRQSAWLGQFFARQPVAPQHIFTSPFVRCQQTATFVAKPLALAVTPVPWLAHGVALDACYKGVASLAPLLSPVVLVGHEPELSLLLAALLQREASEFHFSKAGVALLQGSREGWQLRWQQSYQQLVATSTDITL